MQVCCIVKPKLDVLEFICSEHAQECVVIEYHLLLLLDELNNIRCNITVIECIRRFYAVHPLKRFHVDIPYLEMLVEGQVVQQIPFEHLLILTSLQIH